MCIVLGLGFGGIALADTPSGLYVTGRGEVDQRAGSRALHVRSRAAGDRCAALKQDVDRVTGAVVALAEKLGVKRDDITAAVIQVRPEYRYLDGRSVLEGINVSRTVRVDLKDLRRYGELTDGAIAAGVNQMQNVELDFADRTALEQQALDAAIDRRKGRSRARRRAPGHEARTRARSAVAGHRRRRADSAWEWRPPKSPTQIAFRPGSLRVERQVQVRYELVVP